MRRRYTKHVSMITAVVFGLLLVFCSSCKKNDRQADRVIEAINSTICLTENYPPWNYEEEGDLSGVSVDLLEALFGKMGVNLSVKDIILKNWTEAYQQVLDEKGTMLFSTARIPEREDKFKWVGPIVAEKNIIVALASNSIALAALTDLNSYSIGVIRDYAEASILSD